MNPNEKGFLGILFGIGAAVLIGYLIVIRDGDGDVIDEIGDTLVTLTSTDEMRLAKLEPETQSMVRTLIDNLSTQGIMVKVGQTLRTPAEEKGVIAAGKSAVKTHSWHELGRAVDLYPIDPDTGSADLKGARLDLFQAVAESATALGFRSIAFNADGSKRIITNAQGKGIWDGGHLEWHGPYATIAEAVSAEGEAYGIA